jgi:hypothetical protein
MILSRFSTPRKRGTAQHFRPNPPTAEMIYCLLTLSKSLGPSERGVPLVCQS